MKEDIEIEMSNALVYPLCRLGRTFNSGRRIPKCFGFLLSF
jgi:hypothetical protein